MVLYVVRSTYERDHNTGRFTPPAPTKRHIPISYHCPHDCASPHTPTLRGQSLHTPQYMEQTTSRPTDTSTTCCCTWHTHTTLTTTNQPTAHQYHFTKHHTMYLRHHWLVYTTSAAPRHTLPTPNNLTTAYPHTLTTSRPVDK
jgi:hypothetical protein